MAQQILTLVALGLTGCFAQPNVAMRFTPQAQARAFAPVDAAQVTRYWGLDWENLPEGVTLVGRPEAPTGVAVEHDFPSAADAHEILGVLALSDDDLPGHKDERAAFVAAEVGRRGGNAYVEMPRTSNVLRVVLLHLSAAAPALAYPPAATLLAEPLPELAAYQASGPPETRRLDAFAPFTIDGKRGSCYAVRAALDSSAMLNRRARRALALKVASPAVHLVDAKGSQVRRGARVSARGVAAIIGCPTSDGPIPIAFNVGFDSKRPDAGATLGTGAVQLQVYEHAIAGDELDRRGARQASEAQTRDDRQREQFKARSCMSCTGQLARCPGGTDPARCDAYRECLFRIGMSVEQCVP